VRSNGSTYWVSVIKKSEKGNRWGRRKGDTEDRMNGVNIIERKGKGKGVSSWMGGRCVYWANSRRKKNNRVVPS
jgi:hypothetical protein